LPKCRPTLAATAPAVTRWHELTYTYDTQAERTGITGCSARWQDAGIRFKDLQTEQSSLEEIFVEPRASGPKQ
jgi:ABC-2 type transport system ATP-binding protein